MFTVIICEVDAQIDWRLVMLDDVIIHEIEHKRKAEEENEDWRQIQLPIPQYDPFLTPPPAPSKEREPRRVIEIEL